MVFIKNRLKLFDYKWLKLFALDREFANIQLMHFLAFFFFVCLLLRELMCSMIVSI